MKRILALAASLALLLTLAGCNAQTEKAWYPYDLSEYVALEDWHGFKASYDDPTVCTEEEIDEAILQVMLTYATFDHKDGAAELYDMVRFDYFVYFGEELLDDYTVSDYELTLGQTSMGDMDACLAEQMMGCTAGDACVAEYTFPNSAYLYGALAEKTVRLIGEIHEVFSPTIPPCDEEFVQGLSEESFQTVDDFRAAVREDILDQKKENRIYAVWQAFSGAAQVLKYPEAELESYQASYLSYYQEYADEYELDLDEFLKTYFSSSEEEFRQEALEYAQSMVRNDMIFTQLARLMGTTLSDEEYQEGLQAYYDKESASYEDLDAYVEAYGEDVIRENLIWDKSLRALAEQSVRIEK